MTTRQLNIISKKKVNSYVCHMTVELIKRVIIVCIKNVLVFCILIEYINVYFSLLYNKRF